jgi:hypothetical protein
MYYMCGNQDLSRLTGAKHEAGPLNTKPEIGSPCSSLDLKVPAKTAATMATYIGMLKWWVIKPRFTYIFESNLFTHDIGTR